MPPELANIDGHEQESREVAANEQASQQNSEAVNAAPVIVQAKLTVGAADDPYEKEADNVADKVMRMPDQNFVQLKCAHCEEEEKKQVQRKELSDTITPLIQTKGEGNVTVSDAVSNELGAAGSSGYPIENSTRSFMQSRFGADFSTVRIHTGSKAIQMSRDLRAKAFTTGNNVYFNEGQYQPGSDSGKRLLAHELTHVIQQGAASSPSLGLRRKVQRQMIQRAPVDTFYGKFIDSNYKANKTKDGVTIQIDFQPDDVLVDATTIGMVQSVKSVLKGSASHIHPTNAERAVAAGAGEGSRIDQLARFGNPIFPTGQDAPGDTLASTATVATDGQNGFRFTDKGGNNQKQNAILIDRPTLPGAGKNSGQFFETTAVAVAGAQEGTYYGSVSWGWERDAAGKFKILPFQRVSKDIPSFGFIQAAEKWNSATVLGTIKTTQNPTQVFNNSFNKAFTVAKDSVVTINRAALHNNVFFSDVTITATGKKGFIKTSDLKDQGDGNATIDLPIPVPIYSGPFDDILDIMPLAQVERNTRVKMLDDTDIIHAFIQVMAGPHKDKKGWVNTIGGIPFKNVERDKAAAP